MNTEEKNCSIIEKGESKNCRLTLAICSNRIENIKTVLKQSCYELQNKDEILLILDTEENNTVRDFVSELNNTFVKVIINGENLGLSESRNIALRNCKTEFLIFIDDDVLLPNYTLELIRKELKKGIDIVGVKILGPQKGFKRPWYITSGQLHYLAIHNCLSERLTIWGACMGLNMLFLRNFEIKFRDDLGRKGNYLQSGDDTTFLNEMRLCGANETFLSDAYVFHNIDPKRLSLKYILRRSYWQGKSEVRRQNCINGFTKEWKRFHETDSFYPQKMFLAFLYSSVLIGGMLSEIATLIWHRLNLFTENNNEKKS